MAVTVKGAIAGRGGGADAAAAAGGVAGRGNQAEAVPCTIRDGKGRSGGDVGGANEHFDHGLDRRAILDGLAEIELVVEVALLGVGQQEAPPGPARRRIGRAVDVGAAGDVASGESLVGVVVVVQGQTALLEVVRALEP